MDDRHRQLIENYFRREGAKSALEEEGVPGWLFNFFGTLFQPEPTGSNAQRFRDAIGFEELDDRIRFDWHGSPFDLILHDQPAWVTHEEFPEIPQVELHNPCLRIDARYQEREVGRMLAFPGSKVYLDGCFGEQRFIEDLDDQAERIVNDVIVYFNRDLRPRFSEPDTEEPQRPE